MIRDPGHRPLVWHADGVNGTWDAAADAVYINLRGGCTDLALSQVVVDTGHVSTR